jgi:type II secretion system protein G
MSGFTLIEVLVVMLVIGALALLIIPMINSSQACSRDAKRLHDMVMIQKALEQYRLDFATYPTNLNVLKNGTIVYFKTIPTDPRTDKSYYAYKYSTGNGKTTYTLTDCLESTRSKSKNTVTSNTCVGSKLQLKLVNGN